ncbi:hypothetical protein [Hyalangium versicolor]|uniref:hypothetical protein n=1 Tax=Hyalangium versicolor TaxID=2861190 RepID=UPI001CCDCF21|nr:hypothetical protein [Hyalangium versicolor]
MKTLAVALLFVLSLMTLFSASRADALSQPSIQPRMARPQALPEGDDDKDGKDDDEDDEEEYRGLTPRAALELVDPGGRDDVLRLRIAALRGR